MNRTGWMRGAVFVTVLANCGAHGQPQLQLGAGSVLQGQDGYCALMLSGGMEAYAGVNATLVLPSGVAFTGVSSARLLSEGEFNVDIQTNGNRGTFIAYSGTDTFSETEGSVLFFHVRASSGAVAGTYPVTFAAESPDASVVSSHALANADGSISVSHGQTAGTITILADSDRDGISDVWEMSKFGSLSRAGVGSDADGDGMPDGDEWRAGTDPKSGASKLRVVCNGVATSPGQGMRFDLSWSSVSGGIYDVERSFDMISWTRVAQNVEATPPLNVFSEVISTAEGRAFYRVRLLPWPYASGN